MSKRVCPWWLGYFLLNPFRRCRQNPSEILAPYVRNGMTVLEPSPGMGFFTLELLRRVGTSGRVIAVDVQQKMLDHLKRRAEKASLSQRLEARLAKTDAMGIDDLSGKVDFTLAFAVVHEFPSSQKFFSEIARVSKPGAQVLFAEPSGHVKEKDFQDEIQDAVGAGFVAGETAKIRGSAGIVLRKP